MLEFPSTYLSLHIPSIPICQSPTRLCLPRSLLPLFPACAVRGAGTKRGREKGAKTGMEGREHEDGGRERMGRDVETVRGMEIERDGHGGV